MSRSARALHWFPARVSRSTVNAVPVRAGTGSARCKEYRMSHDDGEGPIDDPKAARERAKAERSKPEHRYQPDHTGRDPRDDHMHEADLDDPTKQKGHKP